MSPASIVRPVDGLVLLTTVLLIGCGSDPAPKAVSTEGATVETVTTEDGLELDARLFFGHRDRIVILLHMFSSTQIAWYPFAQELQENGISVLTINFRGYGASEGDKHPGQIDRDVRAALMFSRERGYQHVVLLGGSMGGTAAIVVAAEESVDGVISLSGPSRIRSLDAIKAIQRINVPLGLVAASEDLSAMNAFETLSKGNRLGTITELIVPGRAHGSEILESIKSAELRRWILDFLSMIWDS
jgi:pimeloyl-ACP methyl ester carboxylesterase